MKLTRTVIQSINYIIVGQGLAGSALALQLISSGKTVKVFDEPDRNRCSTVAAGLFNPITGKMLTKTWMADQLYPFLDTFYRSWEEKLQSRFYFPQDLYRPFLSIEEQNEWMAKSAQSSLQGFIKDIFATNRYRQARDPFGGMVLRQCGYVDVMTFLREVRQWLIEQNAFAESYLDTKRLQVFSDHVEYENISADAIIFTTGTGKNSFFDWVPIRPLKGEVLCVALQEAPEVIFNRGVYVVPSADGLYKVGATYQPHHTNDGITPEGRAELEDKLRELTTIPFQVRGQDWGVRPTTPDRKPILGCHFEHKNVVIFNGLGTKGVSQAPYFATQLANWLLGKGEIDPQVNIERFKALYSKSLA